MAAQKVKFSEEMNVEFARLYMEGTAVTVSAHFGITTHLVWKKAADMGLRKLKKCHSVKVRMQNDDKKEFDPAASLDLQRIVLGWCNHA